MSRRRSAAFVAGLVVLTGCTPGGDAGAPTGATSSVASGASDAVLDRTATRQEIQGLLDERTSAVLAGAAAGFRGTTLRTHARESQMTWFRQLTPLPLAHVGYVLGTHDATVTDPDRFEAEVDVMVQLEGFDPAPVPTRPLRQPGLRVRRLRPA